MQIRMLVKQNRHTLLVGMYTNLANVEISVEVHQKLQNRITISSICVTPGKYSKELWCDNLKRTQNSCVCILIDVLLTLTKK